MKKKISRHLRTFMVTASILCVIFLIVSLLDKQFFYIFPIFIGIIYLAWYVVMPRKIEGRG
jgi:uncharacterized membrane protein YozB (DUF420 family)